MDGATPSTKMVSRGFCGPIEIRNLEYQMARKKPTSPARQTEKRSPAWEKTAVPPLYKRVGKQRISWIYKHMDGRSQTLTSCDVGDREARFAAERKASRAAIEIQEGVVVAGSVADMIERFELQVDPEYYADQSKDGRKIRKAMYENLAKFFGKMGPEGRSHHRKGADLVHTVALCRGPLSRPSGPRQPVPVRANETKRFLYTMGMGFNLERCHAGMDSDLRSGG